MDCEKKHKDMKENIKTLFGLVGGRVKWQVFAIILVILVGIAGTSFQYIFRTQTAMAQEHKYLVAKDDFKEFRQEVKEDMNEIKQLIREIE